MYLLILKIVFLFVRFKFWWYYILLIESQAGYRMTKKTRLYLQVKQKYYSDVYNHLFHEIYDIEHNKKS